MISVSPLSGIKNVTSFTFKISPSVDNPLINWGNDTFSYTNTATNVYSEKGVYNIYGGSCSATSAFQLSVFDGYFFTDNIIVTSNATSSIVSNPHNFVINLSSSNEYNTVVLYSSGSQSKPYSDKREFWTHLTPEWSFMSEGVNISEITMIGSPVYSGTNILGYSAMSSVDYIDDMVGHRNLWFTVKHDNIVPINSRTYSTLQHSICASIPDKLFITSDGIRNFNALQWSDIDIPYVVSVGSSQNSATNILHYVSGNLTDVKFSIGCYGINPSDFLYSTGTIELTDGCKQIGGYLLTSFSLPTSALPDAKTINNLSDCNPDYEKLEYSRIRKNPSHVTLSATGTFSYNGIDYLLSGVSEPFDIIAFENRHEFFRKGEDKNIYDILKESMHFDIEQYPNFNNYLSTVAGSGDSLGKTYDKIHNFFDDNFDIDRCTVDALINKSIALDEPIDTFGLVMPEELRRIFDFSSVSLQKLIGSRCVCNNNFVGCAGCATSNACTICKFDKRSNIGDKLTVQDYVSAGQIILYKEPGDETFNFLSVKSQASDVYLLGALSAEPVYSRGIGNYCFYKWDNRPQNNPVDSLVNYKDPRNSLNPSLSSNEDWYGDNGVLEEMFSYIMTKNLLNN